jgi:uncharacterized membrane protein HdeD (DUF308 family)
MSIPSTPLNPEAGIGQLKKRSGWDIFMGVLTAALGVLLIIYPLVAAAITTIVIGSILIIVGIVDIVLALRSHTAGRFFLRLILGVAYGFVGFLLLAFPLWGVAVLTVVLGVLLLVEAGMATALGFQMRPAAGWGWFLFDAVITAILGVLILYHWPASAVWAIGTLVGAAVLVRGITRIAVSIALRRTVRNVVSFPGERAA